jgi:peptidoglycan hydrolase-like protein with peptidoglycan-binding domain
VLQLERRLDDLGYWTGRVDGVFDGDTKHAVVALQKAARLDRDGIVGQATNEAVTAGIRPVARSTSGRTIEIDLTNQLFLVVDEGVARTVLDTSTGASGRRTPTGAWRISREIDGYHRSRLGLLYRPKYFYAGYAIHGYTSVPPYPASHGCVRLTYHAMDALWSSGWAPVGTPVWIY